MNDGELKPCPFCGGEAEVVHNEYRKNFRKKEYWYIRCACCRATSAATFTEGDAVRDWNRRAK